MKLELVEKMDEAMREMNDEEMEEGSGKFISTSNVSSYLGKEYELQEVIEQMVTKLKGRGKCVKDFNTP